MAQHTPGPWEAKGNAVYAAHKCIATTEGFRIATRDADTRLIAAAPEMLEELREILNWAVTENAPLRKQEIQSVARLIAKAEGRS